MFDLLNQIATTGTNAFMQQHLAPIMRSLVGLAGTASVLFLIAGGYEYMSSNGDPEKLQKAKKTIKNAIIGLVIVVAAGLVSTILLNAYNDTPNHVNQQALQSLETIDPEPDNEHWLLKLIFGMFRGLISSIGDKFLYFMDYFTNQTPLTAQNPAVFKLWLTVLAIANSLFVLFTALIGFRIMSASTLGIDEIEFKHLLPQLAATMLAMNMSIFIIDMIIALSNAMITAVASSFETQQIWDTIGLFLNDSAGLSIAGVLMSLYLLCVMVALLVYYVSRTVTIFLGAVLSPLVIMLQIVPSLKDVCQTAIRSYLMTIFVLFVHAVVLLLASTILDSIRDPQTGQVQNALFSLTVGIGAMSALLKTQGAMSQMALISTGPKAMRHLGGAIANASRAGGQVGRQLGPVYSQTRKLSSRAYSQASSQVSDFVRDSYRSVSSRVGL